MSLRPRSVPRDGALATPVLLFLLASIVGHASSDLRLSRSTVAYLCRSIFTALCSINFHEYWRIIIKITKFRFFLSADG